MVAAVEAGAAMEAARPVLPMLLIGGVMLVTFTLIAFNLVHKMVAALSGAIVAVAIAMAFSVYHGKPPYETVHEFIAHDLNVLGVIVGTSILVEIARSSGLFHFIAIKLVKATGGDPSRLFPAVLATTIAFVTFLTIAPAVLIMTSLVLVVTKALDDDPKPYVLAVAIGANSGALMTFASGIPTLMIGTSAGIPYLHFFVVSTPLALLSAIPAYAVLRRVYGPTLFRAGGLEQRRAKVAQFDEWALVKDRALFVRSAVILGCTIVGFASAQRLGVGLDLIAICGGTAALLFSGFDPEEAVKKIKWPVILFFVGLFVLIGSVRETGLLDILAQGLYRMCGDSVLLAVLLIVPFAFVLSGIVDNIPVAATMIPVIHSMVDAGLSAPALWWSLIAACNLGGNPTPVGSISAVIALHILEKERGVHVGWGEYLRVGGLITAVQIILVIVYMTLFHLLGLFPAIPP